MNDPIAIHVENVHVRFEVFLRGQNGRRLGPRRRKATVNALSDISFTVRQGQALGLIGRNGAGKSTLMRTIAGIYTPIQGRVLVSSQPRSLGVNSALNRELTGMQNIKLGLLSLGYSPGEVEALTPAVAGFSRLGTFLEAPVKTFSTGMAARLRFAIATQQQPEILLLDEALAVGDDRFKRQSQRRLLEIRQNAGAIIIASHSMVEITRSCTEVLWLKDGRIAGYGDPGEVIAAYQADRTADTETITGA